MHQKHPPAKIAVLVAGEGELWARLVLTRSATAIATNRARSGILCIIVDVSSADDFRENAGQRGSSLLLKCADQFDLPSGRWVSVGALAPSRSGFGPDLPSVA